MAYINGKEVLFDPRITIGGISNGYSKEEADERFAKQKDVDTLESNLEKVNYKHLFSQYGTDDGGDGNGYIAISIPSNSVIEIDIEEDYNAEHLHSYLQVACGGDGHFHKVLVNSANCKVYAYADNYGGNGTWYIPWQLNMSGVGVSVSARCVSNANIDYVSGEWIWGTPREAEWWSEITEHYATKDDIGDIDTALDNIIALQEAILGGDA